MEGQSPQFSYPIWPAVKRVSNGWRKHHVNGQLIDVHETVYITYVRKEHEGVFYLSLCVGRYMSKKYIDPEAHNGRALNQLTINACFFDKFGEINLGLIDDYGTPICEKHDDQRSEKEHWKHRFGIEIK